MLNFTPLTMNSLDEDWTAALKLLNVKALLAGLAALAVSQNADKELEERAEAVVSAARYVMHHRDLWRRAYPRSSAAVILRQTNI